MHWKRLSLGALALGALSAAIVTAITPHVDAQNTARVRVAHMAPGAPNVDVLVDGQRAIANLAFPNATEYAALPSGGRDVRVTPAGQNQSPVITAQLPLQAGSDYTVVAVGRAPDLAALPLQDDNRAPAAGKAKVRVVHASPDAPAVDVAVTGGPVLFQNLTPRTAQGYNEVDAGTYNLEVRAAGTSNVALRVPNVALQAGQIVTVFATGLVGDNSLRAVPVTYPVAGTGGAGAAAAPRTGTGGGIGADSALNPWLLGGLALVALTLVAGAGRLATVRRRVR